jgi:hypothetical protein
MDQNNTETRTLTVNDPVDQDTLDRFAQLDMSANQVCRRVGDMELERVRLVRALATLDSERSKLFEKILMDRGLAPTTVIHINPQTGEITMDSPPVENPTG